ncbi:MAG: hypothetical protein ACE5GA_10135, partial [Candidatus Zixiibacteriota bacterium]
MELLNSIGISEQQLIQAGLDLAGYLASAGLTLMLYVSFLNRRARKVAMASYSETKKSEIKAEGAKDRTSNDSGVSFMR